MKKIPILLFLFLLFFSSSAEEHGIIIGFRGQNESFDQRAFEKFAKKRNLIPITVSPYKISSAVTIINNHNGYYELYGYSLGAYSISKLIRILDSRKMNMPGHITTVGAYHSTDVDFSKYNISFSNYFDNSGSRQKSPGTLLLNVRHDRIQEHVNTLNP